MTENQLNEWKANNGGFTSLSELLNYAIDDVNSIVENDYETARKYKEFYSQYLIFNDDPNDDELFNPYLPMSNWLYAHVLMVN